MDIMISTCIPIPKFLFREKKIRLLSSTTSQSLKKVRLSKSLYLYIGERQLSKRKWQHVILCSWRFTQSMYLIYVFKTKHSYLRLQTAAIHFHQNWIFMRITLLSTQILSLSRWLKDDVSNMAIVDVKLVSGFTVNERALQEVSICSCFNDRCTYTLFRVTA